ncbi:MAG: hypothetical protein EOP76_15265 [Variovorax sp.]|nr:MAG: hypothetical protein EOP76_15265 [Variovorax sp.]
MKKLAAVAMLAFTGLTGSVAVQAQVSERDRQYCASGRSGMDFGSCMRQMQYDRERERDRYERRNNDGRGGYDRRDDDRRQWSQPAPPPPGYQQHRAPVEQPRLSDMQERALNNCNMLAPRDQPRCRATVMSTVR